MVAYRMDMKFRYRHDAFAKTYGLQVGFGKIGPQKGLQQAAYLRFFR